MDKNIHEPTGFQDVVRAYTKGLKTRDLQRLFERDAVEAYGVLARETEDMAEPSNPVKRFFFRAKIIFLGLSFKLSPARRALFAAALLLTFFGVIRLKMRVAPGNCSPGWIRFNPRCRSRTAFSLPLHSNFCLRISLGAGNRSLRPKPGNY